MTSDDYDANEAKILITVMEVSGVSLKEAREVIKIILPIWVAAVSAAYEKSIELIKKCAANGQGPTEMVAAIEERIAFVKERMDEAIKRWESTK